MVHSQNELVGTRQRRFSKELRQKGLEASLTLKTHTLWRLAEPLPMDEIRGIIPGLIGHNLARPEIREAILEEVSAALELEGKQPLGALFEPVTVAQWRETCVAIGGPILSEFAATPEFSGWLTA